MNGSIASSRSSRSSSLLFLLHSLSVFVPFSRCLRTYTRIVTSFSSGSDADAARTSHADFLVLSSLSLSPVSADSRLIPFLSAFFLFVPHRSPNLGTHKSRSWLSLTSLGNVKEREREKETTSLRPLSPEAHSVSSPFTLLAIVSAFFPLLLLTGINSMLSVMMAGTRALVIRDEIRGRETRRTRGWPSGGGGDEMRTTG